MILDIKIIKLLSSSIINGCGYDMDDEHKRINLASAQITPRANNVKKIRGLLRTILTRELFVYNLVRFCGFIEVSRSKWIV